jgi:hypothetical protein
MEDKTLHSMAIGLVSMSPTTPDTSPEPGLWREKSITSRANKLVPPAPVEPSQRTGTQTTHRNFSDIGSQNIVFTTSPRPSASSYQYQSSPGEVNLSSATLKQSSPFPCFQTQIVSPPGHNQVDAFNQSPILALTPSLKSSFLTQASKTPSTPAGNSPIMNTPGSNFNYTSNVTTPSPQTHPYTPSHSSSDLRVSVSRTATPVHPSPLQRSYTAPPTQRIFTSVLSASAALELQRHSNTADSSCFSPPSHVHLNAPLNPLPGQNRPNVSRHCSPPQVLNTLGKRTREYDGPQHAYPTMHNLTQGSPSTPPLTTTPYPQYYYYATGRAQRQVLDHAQLHLGPNGQESKKLKLNDGSAAPAPASSMATAPAPAPADSSTSPGSGWNHQFIEELRSGKLHAVHLGKYPVRSFKCGILSFVSVFLRVPGTCPFHCVVADLVTLFS